MTELSANLLIFCLVCLADARYIYEGFVRNCKRQDRTLYCTEAIPTSIPQDVTNVVVNDFMNDVIYSEMFNGRGWTNVTSLTITAHSSTIAKAQAFKGLQSLLNLRLHGERMEIENGTFKGIGALNILDLSYCLRLTFASLISSLNDTDSLPEISTLNISQIGVYKESVRLDPIAADILGSKRIYFLSISGTTVSVLNLTVLADHLCDTLEFIDLSYSHLPDIRDFTGLCPSLKRIDMKGTVLAQVFPKVFPANIYYPFDLEMSTCFKFITNINEINVDRLLEHGLPKVENITVAARKHVAVNIKKFSLANNGIRYLDLKLTNVSNTIEYLDLSWNGLMYLQPLILSKTSPLRYIDLSHNDLHWMADNNFTEFGILLSYFHLLETVKLSDNKLSNFPKDMFKYNKLIQTVDLSNNHFDQIDFDFTHNVHLIFLNLQRSRFNSLSSKSVKVLQSAIRSNKSFSVDLRNNDLLCNQCKYTEYIRWIVDNSEHIVTDRVCIGEHGHIETIDTTTISKLEGICLRTIHIVIASVTAVGGTAILISSFVILVMYRRRKNKKSRLNCMIDEIRLGQYRYMYPAFLAFSGNDEIFVENHVMIPLTAHLQDTIGTDREVICTGDRHFQPGHSIAEQTEKCCRKCGVVILVISKSFCASPHCNYEVHIAFSMHKPLILMFKEHVSPEDMPPVLRTIFSLYTRITWKTYGDRVVMSTTWQNVCGSILELMMEQPRLSTRDRFEEEN